jgi:hypothetical protein
VPKHQDPTTPVNIGWGNAAALALAGVVVLALLVWGATVLNRPSTTASVGGSGQPAVARSSPPAALPQLTACRQELALADAVATAGDASSRDWGMHVGAQVQLDQGRISVAQTKAMWAASKKRGPADVRAFARALTAWQPAAGGCRSLAAVSHAASPVRSRAAACLSRSAAARAAVAAGTEVDTQWSAHLDMMANKPHTDGASYSRRWLQMVRDAQGPLKAYEQARRRLAAAPRCDG